MKPGREDPGPFGSGKKYKKCCAGKERPSPFIVTREVYERDFLPVYDLERCTPKILIEFEIVLPFHIPMYRGNTVTLSLEHGYFSFRFDTVATNDSYKYPLDVELPILKVDKSRVLMMAAVDLGVEAFLESQEEYHNIYFDSLLEELNNIILSYMIGRKDDDCHYITKEMLPASILVRTTDIAAWESGMGVFLLHPHVPVEKEPLSQEELQEMVRIQTVVLNGLNPFVNGEQFAYSARRYYKQGFFLEAVNCAQTNIEILIRTLFEELLRSEGKPDGEIEDTLENTPFMAIIKKQLPNYLGGCWDVEKDTTAAGNWYKSTYALRNKAAHRGRIPTLQQAADAISGAEAFKKFIVGRIKANKKKYPRLNQYFA